MMLIDLGYEYEDWPRSPKQMNSEIIADLRGDTIIVLIYYTILNLFMLNTYVMIKNHLYSYY